MWRVADASIFLLTLTELYGIPAQTSEIENIYQFDYFTLVHFTNHTYAVAYSPSSVLEPAEYGLPTQPSATNNILVNT